MTSLFKPLFILLLFFSIPAFSDQLIIEPDMGRAPILSAIQNAHSSIQLVMYGITDPTLMNALVNAAKNKKVEILLEKTPYKTADENATAIYLLQQNHIPLHWTNPKYQLTHQKTLLLDHNTAIIMTFNFTRSSFTKERNFAVITNNPAVIKEIDHVFQADWEQHSSRKTVNNTQLAWCPDNCRKHILTLIHNAKHSIQIYGQTISDYEVTGALANAAESGVQVQLLLSESADSVKNKKRLAFLTQSGVKIHFNHEYLVHAKVMIIDQQYALLGSINLTQASLNDNRELSIITCDNNVLHSLLKIFNNDWRK